MGPGSSGYWESDLHWPQQSSHCWVADRVVMIRVMDPDIELLLRITQAMEIQSTKYRVGQTPIISGHFVLWNK